MTDTDALVQRLKADLECPDPDPTGPIVTCYAADVSGVLALLDTRTAERDEARKDSARLDWLEQNTATLACNYSMPHPWQVDIDAPDFGSTTTYTGKDARAAIDAATGGAG